MTNKTKFDPVAEWVAIFKYAEENGVEEEKVQQLYKQTNLEGGQPSMKEQELILLRGFVANEIEVRQMKAQTKEGSNADLGIESVELKRAGLTEEALEEESPMAELFGIAADVPDEVFDERPKPANAPQATANDAVDVQTSVDVQEASLSEKKCAKNDDTELVGTTNNAPSAANSAEDLADNSLKMIDGYYINSDGEVVGMTPEAEEKLIGVPPEELGFAPGEQFEIRDEATANWVLEKITSLQMHTEKVKNQTKVIEGRDNTRINGLLWRFGSELHNYGLSQLPIAKTGKKAGQYKTKSLVLTEGTIAYSATGGAKCADKYSFLDYIESIPEEELPFHPAIKVETKRVPDMKAYEAMVANGEEVVGWVYTDVNPVGQMKVKCSKPRGGGDSGGDDD